MYETESWRPRTLGRFFRTPRRCQQPCESSRDYQYQQSAPVRREAEGSRYVMKTTSHFLSFSPASSSFSKSMIFCSSLSLPVAIFSGAVMCLPYSETLEYLGDASSSCRSTLPVAPVAPRMSALRPAHVPSAPVSVYGGCHFTCHTENTSSRLGEIECTTGKDIACQIFDRPPQLPENTLRMRKLLPAPD